jgi:uncharacterized protein YecA (UPF0149 family)
MADLPPWYYAAATAMGWAGTMATSEPAPPAAKSKPPPRPKLNVGRNEPCPCGSGKKFKRCCLGRVSLGGMRRPA